MLHYLSEDPWPLVCLLGLVAMGFLVALWITQQGKYLVRAGVAAGLAASILVVEQLWVTDNERIESVVYDLAQAVEASDSDRVLNHLAPDVVVSAGDTSTLITRLNSLTSPLVRKMIPQTLSMTRFDYVRISKLVTSAGEQSRLGTAEFKVNAKLSITMSQGTFNYATPLGGLSWSLGFRESSRKVWKVTRITPVDPPPEFRWPFGIPSN
jgi:hypothetical protein